MLFKDIFGLLESLHYIVQNDVFANFKSVICRLKHSVAGKQFIVHMRGRVTRKP